MKKILVADDSLTIQKVIRLALSNESYEIQAVSDGKDALEQIALFRPHVVLIDVSLPGFSAFEVKRKINESPEFRHTQFVLMSSAFEQVDESQADDAAFGGRLVKPFDPGNLREVLQSVLSEIPEEEPDDESRIALAPPDPSLVPKGPHKEEEEDLTEGDASPAALGVELESASGELSGSEPPKLSSDLWESGPQDSTPPDEPEETDERGEAPDEDIRKLTESTIKMSGLDDFQWSVNETGRKDENTHPHVPDEEPSSQFTIPPPSDEPSLEPHPNMMDTGGSSFEVPLFARETSTAMPTGHGHREDRDARSVYESAPEAEEPEPRFQSGQSGYAADDLNIGVFDGESEDKPVTRYNDEFQVQDYLGGAEEPARGDGGTGDAIALSNEQIEEIVRKQVQERLHEIAKKMLPDIAERIIKEEIHKMLSNPP